MRNADQIQIPEILSGIPTEILLAELRRRQPRSLPRSCNCGTCRTCKNRATVAAYRERKRLESLEASR